MFDFDITKWTPKFILADRNGYALAKAMEAGLTRLNKAVLQGTEILTDPGKMPEWRLDELAWEYGCPYDPGADIESKRHWIANAMQLYKLWGTKEAIVAYLAGFFEEAAVEECWEYEGDPFHFRVNLRGKGTEENMHWATKAIGIVKSTRSVLDGFRFENLLTSGAYEGCAVYAVEQGRLRVPGLDPEETE